MNRTTGVAAPASLEASARPNAARTLRVALVHYMDSAAVGGSVRIGELLGKTLPGANVEPHFVFAYDGPGPVARATTAACHFNHAKGPGDLRAWIRVRRLIG